jgi:hypothetical protein
MGAALVAQAAAIGGDDSSIEVVEASNFEVERAPILVPGDLKFSGSDH